MLSACGDDGATGESMTTQPTVTTVPITVGSTSDATPTTSGSNSESASESESEGSNSQSGTTSGPGSTTEAMTSDGTTTTTASTTATTEPVGMTETEGNSDGSSSGSETDTDTDTGNNCAPKCGETGWSYVWIANSTEHTISKIDTRTMEEVGRYRTRPDHLGSPSRTSVSIDARAVVVANRQGGITKIWARPEFCEDKNGNGQIDTSTGKFDVRAFSEDECIDWHTEFPGATTQRPVAWTSGVYNEETCEYDNQQIWTAASYGTMGQGCGGAQGIHVYRLNGDTGAIDEQVHLADVPCGSLGAYGAAVDSTNSAWFFVFGGGRIFRVDHDTLAHQVVNKGFYGITVDTKDRVWLDDGSRYDPVTQTWATQIGNLPPNGGSGVAVDLQGRVWHATAGGIGWLDSETMVVGQKVDLPIGNAIARGIGVDVDGYIWAVPLNSTVAYRIDPDTYEWVTYDGLNVPYTYSDMAGGQINNVVCPQ